MKDTIDRHLEQWAGKKSGREALIAVFNHIRNIPYSVLPGLNHPQHYIRIMETQAGSCTPKHLLMAKMVERLGWEVLLVVYPYRWAEFEEIYPPGLWRLAQRMPPAYHLACKVLIEGRYVLMDATLDPPLGCLGLPINEPWDAESDTMLPVHPLGEEEIYHPSEARLIKPPRLNELSHTFYQNLNAFLDRIRNGQS